MICPRGKERDPGQNEGGQLKYFMGMSEVVRVVGTIHGRLFLLYVSLLAVIHFRQRWSVIFSLYAFVASIIPFGTFVLDKQLRAKEAVAN